MEVFWGGFMILFLPEAYFILQKPNEFFNRLNINGTFQTGWLAQTMVNTGHSAFQVLGERVIHAFLALIYYPGIDFYGSQVPMLSLISSAFFLIGLGVVLFRVRQRGYLLLNGYFWIFPFAVGIFSIPPSADSYRMLIALPPAMFMAAIGLDQILEFLNLGWGKSRKKYVVISSHFRRYDHRKSRSDRGTQKLGN
jgi:hypothetical protein